MRRGKAGTARLGEYRFGEFGHELARCGEDRSGQSRQAWRGWAWLGATRHGTAGVDRVGAVRQVLARIGKAGEVRRGEVR